jgi:hypothetical protein
MSIWVRNLYPGISPATTDPRPAWETSYQVSDGETGPRSLVVKLTSTSSLGSGILIAPDVVLTASHVVEFGSGKMRTDWLN